MDNYALRSELRNLESADLENNDFFVLPKELRNVIEEKLFEMDKNSTLVHNYKEVLRDVLSR